MRRKPRTIKQLDLWRTLKQVDAWADARERFLGIDRSRLTLAQRRNLRVATIREERASQAFEDSDDGRRRRALEEQRVEIIVAIDDVEKRPESATNKHRQLAMLKAQLEEVRRLIHGTETPTERSARLNARIAELRAGGNRRFMKTTADEEDISVSRLKQVTGRVKKKPKAKQR